MRKLLLTLSLCFAVALGALANPSATQQPLLVGGTTAAAAIGTPVLIAQSVTAGFSNSASASTSVTAQAGDLVVVIAGPFDSAAPVTSIVDAAANTYVQAQTVRGTNNIGFEVWYAKNITTFLAGSTFTVNTTGSTGNIKFCVMRIPGASLTVPSDVVAPTTTTPSATPTLTTAVLAASTEVVFAAIGTITQTVSAEGAGFTSLFASATGSLILNCAYQRVLTNAAVTYAPTLTGSPVSGFGMGLTSFK